MTGHLASVAPCASCVRGLATVFTPSRLSSMSARPRVSCPACSSMSFLSSICVGRRSCGALMGILGVGGGVVLRNTPNIKGAFATGELTCSVVNTGGPSHIRVVRFRRDCSCRSFVRKCQPARGKFAVGGNSFCGFYGLTRSSSRGSCFFVVSRVGHNGLDGVFNRLFVLVRGSGHNVRLRLLCSSRGFSMPTGMCVVNVVGATSHDLTVLSCTLEQHFSFFAVGPKFGAPNFRTCRSCLGDSTFGGLVTYIGRLGSGVTRSVSLNRKFDVNRDCFYNLAPRATGARALSSVMRCRLVPLLGRC